MRMFKRPLRRQRNRFGASRPEDRLSKPCFTPCIASIPESPGSKKGCANTSKTTEIVKLALQPVKTRNLWGALFHCSCQTATTYLKVCRSSVLEAKDDQKSHGRSLIVLRARENVLQSNEERPGPMGSRAARPPCSRPKWRLLKSVRGRVRIPDVHQRPCLSLR
jgi:hypothetical protein